MTSARGQRVMLWWTFAWLAIWFLVLWLLLDMLPPPSPRMSNHEILNWYAGRRTRVELGAMVDSWIGAFLLPFAAVLTIQLARYEAGFKVWSALAAFGGSLTTIFLCLPPVLFGVAAFTVGHNPGVTVTMHELGVLSLITTDQFFIFILIPVAVICLRGDAGGQLPFPRWLGYYTIWTLLAGETGAFAFLFRSGAFDWRGLLAFWLAAVAFAVWMVVQAFLIFRSLRLQEVAS